MAWSCDELESVACFQVYGVDIAPAAVDDFRVAAAAEAKEVDSRTGSGNDRRQSLREQRDLNKDRKLKDYPTTKAASGARNTHTKKEASWTVKTKPSSQRRKSEPVTRTMSEGPRVRHVANESLTTASQRMETPAQYRHGKPEARTDPASTRRKSRDDAELRVENEVLEAMRREQELRYDTSVVSRLFRWSVGRPVTRE